MVLQAHAGRRLQKGFFLWKGCLNICLEDIGCVWNSKQKVASSGMSVKFSYAFEIITKAKYKINMAGVLQNKLVGLDQIDISPRLAWFQTR